jgi:hypothetical protein
MTPNPQTDPPAEAAPAGGSGTNAREETDVDA